MLKALNRLGGVGVRVIQASKDGTIETLRQLNPVLTELGDSGQNFVKSFNVFLTYPFVDEVVGRDPQVARNLHMGDYTNLSVRLDLTVPGINPTQPPTLVPSELNPTVVLDLVTRCLRSGDIKSKPCTKLLTTVQGLTELKQKCTTKKWEDTAVCQALNTIPGLPTGGGGGGGGLPTGLPSLPGVLGLGRTGVGPTPQAHGPTMGQLSRMFDPALVRLLVPGMVMSR
jgi:phospholipid/cholesterol/gamma-HCH transport system substrate-binding protein